MEYLTSIYSYSFGLIIGTLLALYIIIYLYKRGCNNTQERVQCIGVIVLISVFPIVFAFAVYSIISENGNRAELRGMTSENTEVTLERGKSYELVDIISLNKVLIKDDRREIVVESEYQFGLSLHKNKALPFHTIRFDNPKFNMWHGGMRPLIVAEYNEVN